MATSLVDHYREMHRTSIYGNTSARVAPYILPHIRSLGPHSVIDYGCGQSELPDIIKASGVPRVCRYDPAIPAYAARPQGPFDLLVSIDVLEHIPEAEIDETLSEMAGLTRNAMIIIDIKLAKTLLPNGENAHVTVKPPQWWRERLSRHYTYLEPFYSKPSARAQFKTWRSPPTQRVLLWANTAHLRLRSKLRKITRRAAQV